LRFHRSNGGEKRGTSVCLSWLALTGMSEWKHYDAECVRKVGVRRGEGGCSLNDNKGFYPRRSLSLPHISHNQPVITKLIGKSARLLKMLKEVKEKEIDNKTYKNIKSQLG